MGKFKTTILSLMIAFSAIFYAPKADAVVGLILKNKTTLILSGVSAGLSGVGAILAATGGSAVASGGVLFISAIPIIGALGFAVFGALGIILLDDKTVAEMSYATIDLSDPDSYQGLSKEEVQIYNSEIEELNAIYKTIGAEINSESTVEDVAALWESYREFLSPATVKVAQLKAYTAFKNIKFK